jgi:hypothetical protein
LRRAAYIAVVFFALTATARSEYYTLVLAKPVRSSGLSGVVLDPSGAIIPNATVDMVACPVDMMSGRLASQTLATTHSDLRGEFAFDRKVFKKPYCVHISAAGFNPLEFVVKISPFAGKIRVKLPIGG